jgi:hypothetical protein
MQSQQKFPPTMTLHNLLDIKHENYNCNNIFLFDKVGFVIHWNIKDKTKLLMKLQKELQ